VLDEQRLTGQLLGELLVAKRMVSPNELAVVIAEQHGIRLEPDTRPILVEPTGKPRDGGGRWRPLGRILVDRGVLTESGLKLVLVAQRRRGGLLGQVLLQRGYVTPAQLAEALAEQHGLEVAPTQLASAEHRPQGEAEIVYEVRYPERPDEGALYESSSFLDASDFAFELLYDEDPHALAIVEVRGERRTIAWSYVRPPADAVAAR